MKFYLKKQDFYFMKKHESTVLTFQSVEYVCEWIP